MRTTVEVAVVMVGVFLAIVMVLGLILHVFGVLTWWFTGEYPFTHPWMEELR